MAKDVNILTLQHNRSLLRMDPNWSDGELHPLKILLQMNRSDAQIHLRNLTSSEAADIRRDPMSLVIPITVAYGIIFVAGVLGNAITCTVISRNKSMHTATNYYLFNLAISDLLLLLSGMPPDIYKIWYPLHYPFGSWFCVVQGLLSETSTNATVLTITAFTVERYIAICHPFRQHTMSKLSRAVKFIFVIWILAFCLAVPQCIQFGIIEIEGGTTCTIKNMLIEHVFEVSSFVFFVGPMTVICILYVLIGVKLHKSKLLQGINRKGCDANRNGISAQTRVIRMLVAVVVAFFLCWAPFHAQRLIAVYGSATSSDLFYNIYSALTYISGIFYFLSTSVNPLLYSILSHKFRDAFKSTLARHCGFGRKTKKLNYRAITRNGGAAVGHLVAARSPPLSSGGGNGGSVRLTASVLNRADPIKSSFPIENNLSLIEQYNCHCFPSTQTSELDPDVSIHQHKGRIEGEKLFAEYGDEANNNDEKLREPLKPRSRSTATTNTMQTRSTSLETISELLTGNEPKKKRKTLTKFRIFGGKTLFKFGKNDKPDQHRRSIDAMDGGDRPTTMGSDKDAKSPFKFGKARKVSSMDSPNTISNSSLQEVDDEEFNSSDLVKYMEEVNNGLRS